LETTLKDIKDALIAAGNTREKTLEILTLVGMYGQDEYNAGWLDAADDS
jgi:hypothetical protein